MVVVSELFMELNTEMDKSKLLIMSDVVMWN